MRARKSAATSRSAPSAIPCRTRYGARNGGHQRVGLVGLGRHPRQQDLGLGHQDALEHLVLDQGAVGEHQAALHDLLQGLGVGDLLVEPEEETGELPPDHGRDQLVAPAREVAVDRRPRHARLAGRVLDRRLGQAPAGHAVVGRLQQPLADLGVHSPSSASRPTVRPGRPATDAHRQQHAGHEGAAVVGVVADAQALARRAEDDLLVRDQAGQPHRVHVDAVGPLGAARPGQHEVRRRVGRQRAAAGGPARLGDDRRRVQRRARRRVALGVVVQLDHLHAVHVGRGDAAEVHEQHGADGEVGRDDRVGAAALEAACAMSARSSSHSPLVPMTAWMPWCA